ncbi:MAG TPA: PKD domain-containing protein [Acidimicrobiia bacterium]
MGSSIAGGEAASGASAAPPATLAISGPARASIDTNVSFDLRATSPRAIGAFQANLRFDSSALEVVAVKAPATLPGAGKLMPLSADETNNRKAIGGWTCAGSGCGAASATFTPGQSTLLATIVVEPLKPGAIELRVDDGLLVDTAGSAIGNVSARTILEAGSSAAAYAAPGTLSYSVVAPAATHAPLSLDVNRDGRVTPLDVSALTQNWVRGAESGASCPAPDPGTDINGDGCMTIADLQTVAHGITAAPAAPSALAVQHAVTISYTVNSTADTGDAKSDGICQTSTAGQCTLRAALQEANRATSPVSIGFNIPGAGVHTIAPATRLPALNNPNGITIDGFTQPGSTPNTDPIADNAVYDIELVGTGPSGVDGFFVTQANNVIRGFDMHNFDRSVWIYGTSATNNLVEGNMLGLTPTGAMDPNWTLQAASSCVVVQEGAVNNQIGAPGVANRNVESGCNHQGIATYDYPTKNTTIQNNITGLDPTGTQRRPNKSHGIDINTGTQGTMIGGTDPSDRNVSSGNEQEGVEISHNSLTQNNSIIGNYFGTDLTGNNAFSYTQNGQWSVHLEGDPTCNNAPCDLDMGFATVTNNVIVNAQRGGLLVDKGVHDSTISNNLIGVTANGTAAPNLLFGVNIEAGAVRIKLGPGNTIANNDNGVQLESDGLEPPNSASSVTNQNTITQNSIYNNGSNGVTALGIDLAPFGAVNTTANCDTNVNDCMVAPALSNPTPTSIDATTCASCVVEVFVASQPAGAIGSGQTYLASGTADSNGNVTVTLPSSADGNPVTATATNTNGSTSEFSKNVLVPTSSPGDIPPTAQFTPTCTGLSCSFNGSASTDSDGTIVSYSWDFGDGSPAASGEIVQHTFAPGGPYTVTLTVTDNDAVPGSQSQSVAVADLPPTAAFTGNCNGLSCSFDASSSSDPDNGTLTYAWDFGDTNTDTGEQVAHTYASPNTYTVTLTVDDGQGATNSEMQTFDVTAPNPAVLVNDTFTRTVASGWGSADTGGAYSAATGTSSGSTSVGSGTGAIKLTASPSGRGFYLPSVSVLDSDSVVDVGTSVAPAGGTWGQVGYITARRVDANTEYRVRLRFVPGGGVKLSFVKTVGNTTEVSVGNEVNVPGLTYVAGQMYTVRFDVSGTNPTTLQAKAWVAGTTEPGTWTLTATDSEPTLQVAGNPGVRTYLGGSATNQPTFQFDNFTVTNLDSTTNQPPTASFTASCPTMTCSFNAGGSSDPDGSIVSYAWNYGDGSTDTGVSTSHTYTSTGPFTVTLTVTDNDGAPGSTSQQVTPTAPATRVIAQDAFGRTVASGWGTADVGGAYAAAAGGGVTSVNGSAGTFKITSTSGAGGGLYLPGASALNTDAVVDVSTSVAPAGGTWGQVSYLTLRRVSANTEYRARLRFVPGGAVKLSFVKTVGNTTEVSVGPEVSLTGLSYVAGQAYTMRFDAIGTNPTTLRARVWVTGTTEPTTWNLTATDSQAALQAAGSPGVRVFLGASSTSQPLWLFDNLTVTDLGTVNQPPVASFTGSCTQLACNFNGGGSSDPNSGGSITSYSWDFGDGSPTASGSTASHSYSAANSYTVTLTVTDSEGDTAATSQGFNVSASTVVAQDFFGRSVSSGWGSADMGGAYAAATGASTGAAAVGFGSGVINLTVAPSGRGFYLPSVSVLNSDSVIDVSTNPAPAGGTYGQVAYITARRVNANTEYRVRLRFLPNDSVHLSFVKTVGNTTEVVIGKEITVAGLTDAASAAFRLRFDVTGTNPTTLKAKVWTTRATEPANWQLTATDSQAALQTAGNPGLRAFLGASATNQPAWLFDNFTVTQL